MIAGESITAVVPVHNRADLLEKLLTSARAQTVGFREIIVVDNSSSDNAVAVACSFGCRVLELERNTGFASAVNLGWQSAHTDWVAILNSDVELDRCWVERLTAGVGTSSFATGTLLSSLNPALMDGSYDLVSKGGCAWRAGHDRPYTGAHEPVPIAMAPATACLFRREVLERLKGFDESFGTYLEDVELGMRCLRAGFHGIYVPDAIARHQGSATFGRWNPSVVRLISRNQLFIVRRHYDPALFRACFWHIVIGQILWGLLAWKHGALGAWWAGKREGLRGFSAAGAPCPAIHDFLTASELEIRARATGDSYWRWYFRLTSAAH